MACPNEKRMRIDPNDLRRHYASLPDGALQAIERSELTSAAQAIYDEEVARRELTAGDDAEILEEGDEEGEFLDFDSGDSADWLEDASCACSFTLRSAKAPAPMAVHATEVLHAAGIPFHVETVEEELPTVDPGPRYSLRLMVPNGAALHAASVLDQHLFNEGQEAEWRATLETLSDEDLRALNPEVLCAGLLDRVARLKKAYKDEVARRR